MDQRDWDTASDAVARAYFPHRLLPETGSDASGLVLRSVTLGPVVLAHIGWGADVAVRSEHPGAYAVNIALAGRIVSEVGREDVSTSAGDAAVCPPDVATHIRHWSSTGEILGVRIDRDRLHREAERITGTPGLVLPSRLDLRVGAGAEWFQLVRSVWQQQSRAVELLRSESVADRMGEVVLAGFLAAAGPQPTDQGRWSRPGAVKRVTDALEQDPARPWAVHEMAQISGVSVRRLQEAFAEHLGRSPTTYLREVRLDRAQADLRHGDPRQSVADVALRWGFGHIGRFATAYRQRYGVSPTTTLRG